MPNRVTDRSRSAASTERLAGAAAPGELGAMTDNGSMPRSPLRERRAPSVVTPLLSTRLSARGIGTSAGDAGRATSSMLPTGPSGNASPAFCTPLSVSTVRSIPYRLRVLGTTATARGKGTDAVHRVRSGGLETATRYRLATSRSDAVRLRGAAGQRRRRVTLPRARRSSISTRAAAASASRWVLPIGGSRAPRSSNGRMASHWVRR